MLPGFRARARAVAAGSRLRWAAGGVPRVRAAAGAGARALAAVAAPRERGRGAGRGARAPGRAAAGALAVAALAARSPAAEAPGDEGGATFEEGALLAWAALRLELAGREGAELPPPAVRRAVAGPGGAPPALESLQLRVPQSLDVRRGVRALREAFRNPKAGPSPGSPEARLASFSAVTEEAALGGDAARWTFRRSGGATVEVLAPFDDARDATFTFRGSLAGEDAALVGALARALARPSPGAAPRSDELGEAFGRALDAGLGELLGSVMRGLDEELRAAGIPTFGAFGPGTGFGADQDDEDVDPFWASNPWGTGRGGTPGAGGASEADEAARWVGDVWAAAVRAAREGAEGPGGAPAGPTADPAGPAANPAANSAGPASPGVPAPPSSLPADAAEEAELARRREATLARVAEARRAREAEAARREGAEKLAELGVTVFWPPPEAVTEVAPEREGGAPADTAPEGAPPAPRPYEPLDWGELAGYEDQKRAVEETALLWLRHPEEVARIVRGTRRVPTEPRPRALLLEGPPGTGKTSVARALARAAGVPLVYVPLEAIGSKWYGEAERRLADAFAAARQLGPPGCLVFLDELDALAGRRSGDMHEATRRTLGVLLRELDGLELGGPGGGVGAAGSGARAAGSGPPAGAPCPPPNLLVVAATNRAEDLDPALASRFSSVVTFGLPDAPCRLEILAGYAVQLDGPELRALAAATDGFAGRDIRALCEAAERRWAARAARGLGGGLPDLGAYLEAAAERRRALERGRALERPGPGATLRPPAGVGAGGLSL